MHPAAQHIPQLIRTLAPTIHTYGYWGVGGLVLLEDFGVPVPGETVLIAAAFYAGLGQLNIFMVAIIAIIGAILGDNIGFGIGYYGGHPLIERFGRYIFLTPTRIQKVEQFYTRYGGKVVAVARFFEGLRQANGIIAGLSEMRWLTFLLYNALGAALWVSMWSLIGYFGGSHIETFLKYDLYLTIAAVICIVGYIVYRATARQSK
jgi:membrane protein DedA with SNARE-associated domain